MGNGFMVITEKDWENATTDQRMWWTFNTLQSVDSRLKRIEGRRWYDKVASFAGGIFGGALAALGVRWGS
jgi:hypothetical protein